MEESKHVSLVKFDDTEWLRIDGEWWEKISNTFEPADHRDAKTLEQEFQKWAGKPLFSMAHPGKDDLPENYGGTD